MAQHQQVKSEACAVGRIRRLRAAFVMMVMVGLGAGILPAHAADEPTRLPSVTVSGDRNPGASPAEVAYADTVFGRLDKASRYPTGREASETRPSGTAKVWVEVARSGKVVGHGLEAPSGSKLLDQMAVSLATRAKYASLPADVWASEAKHRFVVSYAFDGAAMTGSKQRK